jgi:hypothetical protein
MTHSPLPVAGYTDQSADKVDIVNWNKQLEEQVLRRLEDLKGDVRCDPRMIAIAFTKVQEAFMWANRAVFQPKRITLPEDRADIA